MSTQRLHTFALWILVAGLVFTSCSARSQPRSIPAEQRAAVNEAIAWLGEHQEDDGRFDAGFGHPAGITCDAALAIAAAGGDPVTTGEPSLVEYLAETADEYVVDAATAGKLIVALIAAGENPREFGGKDWVAHLQSFRDGSGAYDPGAVGQAWAILALKAAGQNISPSSVNVLRSYQLETGAWASAFGPDNDTVSYSLQALAAAAEPKDSAAVERALAFLKEQQNEDGGFPAIKPSEWGTDTNANSTANVIMALLAVGEEPVGKEWSQPGGDPMSALMRLQADDGRVEFQPGMGEPLLSTVQAIPALMNASLPLKAK